MIVICQMCHKAVDVPCTEEQYWRWRQHEGMIQDVMPDVPKQLRELLISGTCPECWDTLFKNLDEEE